MNLLTHLIIQYKLWRLRRYLKSMKKVTKDIEYLEAKARTEGNEKALKALIEFATSLLEVVVVMVAELNGRFDISIEVEEVEVNE